MCSEFALSSCSKCVLQCKPCVGSLLRFPTPCSRHPCAFQIFSAGEMTRSKLRSDKARQFVINAHDHAHDLTGAKRCASRYADSGSADLGPCRPTCSVVNVRIKSVVDCDHTADQLAGRLGCAIVISGPLTTESAVRAPVTHCPGTSIEPAPVDSTEIGFCEASHLSTGVHGRAIGHTASQSSNIEETFPLAAAVTIHQGSAARSEHRADHTSGIVGSTSWSGGGGSRKRCELAPRRAVVDRPL